MRADVSTAAWHVSLAIIPTRSYGEKRVADVTITRQGAEACYTGEAGNFRITIDRAGKREPRSIDLVLLGLGTCTISTVSHYLERKGLSSRTLGVELSADFDEKQGCYVDFRMKLKIDDALPADLHKTLAAVARTCRIHKTLASTPQISVEVASTMPAASRV
jgi:uncharacterized OsmC-like protein